MKKNMERARSEGKPKGSPSLEYIIDMFESEQVPGRFLRAYLGNVSAKIKGEILHSLCLRCVVIITLVFRHVTSVTISSRVGLVLSILILCLQHFILAFPGRTHRAVILGDRDSIRQIGEKSTFYHVDATFAALPGFIDQLKARSAQILNIVANYGAATVSVATVIMSGRRVPLYKKIFDFLRDSFPELKPTVIMADWEAALRKTLSTSFTEARILGCW